MPACATAATFRQVLIASSLCLVAIANAAPKVSTEYQAGVDPHGRAMVSIPIAVPPGTAGMAPSIALTYSNQGMGLAGLGWSLGVTALTTRARMTPSGLTTESGTESVSSSVTRCPSTIATDGIMGGIKLDSTDRFCLDGQRLVVQGSGTYGADGTEYRTEVESFTKVVSYGTAGNGPAWFKVWTKEGLIAEYGNTADSRVEAPLVNATRLWAVNKVFDRSGNYYTASYSKDANTGEYVPVRIDYTGNAAANITPYNSVRFVHETRPDATVEHIASSSVQRRQRLINIKTYTDETLVKDYRLGYGLSAETSRSLVTSVTECDGAGICLPALSFGYTPSEGGVTTHNPMNLANMVAPQTIVSMLPGDFNGDGAKDVWVVDSNGNGRICYGPSFTPSECSGMRSVVGYEVLVLDFNGDGFSDLVQLAPNGDMTVCAGPTTTSCPSINFAIYPKSNFAGYKMMVGDFNGDGRDDLFVWHPTDPSQANFGLVCNVMAALAQTGYCNAGGLNGSGYKLFAGDFDGDGMTDLLYAGSNHYQVCTGRAISSFSLACSYVATTTNWRDSANIVVGDFNGDGMADLLRLLPNGLEQCAGPGVIGWNNCLVVGNNGGVDWRSLRAFVGDFNSDGASDLLIVGTWGASVCNGPGINWWVACGGVTSQDWYANPIVVADFNGSGSADILNGAAAQSFIIAGAATKPDLLQWTNHAAFNVGYTFVYATLSDTISNIYTKGSGAIYPLQDTREPLWVVKSFFLPNGVGGQNMIGYKYEKGRFDSSSHRFLGYEVVRASEPANWRETVTTRAQTYPHFYRLTDEKTYVQSTLAARHTVDLASYTSFEGRPFSAPGTEYDVSYGLDGSWRSNKMGYGFDPYGNRTSITLYADEFSITTRKSTSLTVDNDPAQWVFGQLRMLQEYFPAVPGHAEVVTQRQFTPVPNTLLIASETRDPNVPSMKLVTTYGRDLAGNVTSVTTEGPDIEPRTETRIYDANKRFVESETNALQHTTVIGTDARFGLTTSSTDPNQLTTTWTYDGFGRRATETRPDGTWSRWSYELGCCAYPFNANVKFREIRTDSASADSTYTSYDAIGRELFTMRRNFQNDDWLVEGAKRFDLNGRTARKYVPFFYTAEPNPVYEAMGYDPFGRIETVVATTGGQTGYSYNAQPNAGPVTTTITDVYGKTTKQVRNVHGQLTQVIDALNKTTTYQYSPHGHLFLTTAADGSATGLGINQWGWTIGRNDPSLGTWTFTYDSLGNLKTQTDAMGQVTAFAYDKLNRKKQRSEPSMVSTWTYDTGTKGVGKLAVASNGSVVNGFYYDTLGRIQYRTQYVDGSTFTTQFGYDSQGRMNVMTYPTGFAIKRVYSSLNYLSEIRDNATNALIWAASAYSSAGIAEEDYGNGTEVQTSYHPTLRRVTRMETKLGASTLQDHQIGYDLLGNVAARVEATQNLSETFGYDPLYRLETVVGPAPKTYSYGDTGNIQSKSDVGTYSYTTPGKPHAVSAAGGVSYSYDPNGNMTASGNKGITWTSFNMPAAVTIGANSYSWVYDADLQRVKYVTPTETTRYVGTGEGIDMEYQVAPGGAYEFRHFIRVGNRIVAIYVSGPAGPINTYYISRDHLGSTTLVANQSAAIVERLSYDAQGKRRFPNGADDSANSLIGGSSDRGFTSHEHLDGLGLIHMNGRLYDPRIARFASSDPARPRTNNPQALNRYAYVLNSPLRLVDPTGYTDHEVPHIVCIDECGFGPLSLVPDISLLWTRPDALAQFMETIRVSGNRIYDETEAWLLRTDLDIRQFMDRVVATHFGNQCQTGSETQGMIGYGGVLSAGVVLGGGAMAGVTSNNSVILQFQGTVGISTIPGLSFGGQWGAGVSRQPTGRGLSSPQDSLQVDVFVPAGGASFQGSSDGLSFQTNARAGLTLGSGVQRNVANTRTVTIASPQYRPRCSG